MGKLSAQKIITDRPSQAEGSSTITKGSIQIESGFFLGFSELESGTERQILAPLILFRYGITKAIEIRVLNQFENIKNETISKNINGISDINLGTKIQLLRKKKVNTEIAFLTHLIIPTASKGLTNNKFATINKLAISHQLKNNIGVGYNLGYNYYGVKNGDLTYSFAIGVGISEKAAIYIEPYGDFIEFKDHVSNFDAGFTYLLRDNFQLDFSFGTGINNRMNYLSLGFGWNIQKREKNS